MGIMNKRYVLTAFGIVIGISIMTAAIGVFESGKFVLKQRFGNEGTRLFTISNGNGYGALKAEDINVLEKKMPEVKEAIPVYAVDIELQSFKASKTAKMIASEAAYHAFYNLEMVYGRFFTESEVKKESRTVIIDEMTALSLFGIKNALGQQIQADLENEEVALTVIGVCRNPKPTIRAYIKDAFEGFCYIPSTLLSKKSRENSIKKIVVMTPDIFLEDEICAKMSYYLNRENGEKGSYQVESYQQLERIDAFMDSYLYMMIAIAGIALLGGGSTLTGILLLWKEEKRKRIGIQKFFGAGMQDIKWEVLLKSICICLLCGLNGLILGFLMGKLIGFFLGVKMILTFCVLTADFFVSVAVGLAAGIYPASKAAAINEYDVIWE